MMTSVLTTALLGAPVMVTVRFKAFLGVNGKFHLVLPISSYEDLLLSVIIKTEEERAEH